MAVFSYNLFVPGKLVKPLFNTIEKLKNYLANLIENKFTVTRVNRNLIYLLIVILRMKQERKNYFKKVFSSALLINSYSSFLLYGFYTNISVLTFSTRDSKEIWINDQYTIRPVNEFKTNLNTLKGMKK